jgi:hypothetical protein
MVDMRRRRYPTQLTDYDLAIPSSCGSRSKASAALVEMLQQTRSSKDHIPTLVTHQLLCADEDPSLGGFEDQQIHEMQAEDSKRILKRRTA